MKKIHKISLVACLLFSGSASAAENKQQTQPNVLFIAMDDLNDFTGCLGGNPDTKSPAIDRLAAKGVLFTDAHAQAVVCKPSRASVMTGLYAERVVANGAAKDAEVVAQANSLGSLPLYEAFAKQGYKTMAVGKLFHDHVPEGSVDESGGRGSFLPNERLKLNFPQDGTLTDWGLVDVPEEEMPDHQAADWVAERLQQDHKKPFLMMVGFLRPHNPWYVPQRWLDLFPDPSLLTLPPFNPTDFDDIPKKGKSFIRPEMPRTTWAIENNQWGKILQGYQASISFADFQVGRVLEALEKSPYAKNTIVVLWSDHGYHMGEKNTFQKHTLWQRSTHVPLIFAGPGIAEGVRYDYPVGLVDIFPTLNELCQLKAPNAFDGRSLKPLMQDSTINWDRPIFCQHSSARALITEKWHYIHYKDGSEELYDRKNDPKQWVNLALKPETQKIRTALNKQFPHIDEHGTLEFKTKGKKKH